MNTKKEDLDEKEDWIWSMQPYNYIYAAIYVFYNHELAAQYM